MPRFGVQVIVGSRAAACGLGQEQAAPRATAALSPPESFPPRDHRTQGGRRRAIRGDFELRYHSPHPRRRFVLPSWPALPEPCSFHRWTFARRFITDGIARSIKLWTCPRIRRHLAHRLVSSSTGSCGQISDLMPHAPRHLSMSLSTPA